VATVLERGYEAASVAEMAARAGVGCEDFERTYADKGAAFVANFEGMVGELREAISAAYEAGGRWPASLRAAAYALVGWLESHPDAYRFGTIEVLAAPEIARVRREELIRWCASLVDAGREVAPDPAAVPEGAPLLAVGAVAELLARRVAGTLEADTWASVPELMYGAVRPYLGEEAARAELKIPPPAHRAA
jgi:AcrR family transcriptional regulator